MYLCTVTALRWLDRFVYKYHLGHVYPLNKSNDMEEPPLKVRAQVTNIFFVPGIIHVKKKEINQISGLMNS